MRIICDSAALIEPKDQDKYGIKVIPLNVTINNKTYKEFVEINREEFVDLINKGGIPTSSQPSVGEVMAEFEKSNEDTLCITMADGLSGTYQTFVGVKQSMDDIADNITIINSRTLAGPETHLVKKAIRLKDEGLNINQIIEELEDSMKNHYSFLIPQDFNFLLRGGRLSPVAAKIGALVKIVPVLKQSADGKVLEKFAIKRTLKGAVNDICNFFKGKGVKDNYTIYICHGHNLDLAKQIEEWVNASLPNIKTVIDELSPVFITQGGPNCCSVQVIKD